MANPFNDWITSQITEGVKPQHCGVAQRVDVQPSTMLPESGSIGMLPRVGDKELDLSAN